MKILEANLNGSKSLSYPQSREVKNLHSDLYSNQKSYLASNESALGMKKRKNRNKFTEEEDEKLRELVLKHGDKSWNVVSSLMENRNQRQCRERWKHYLSCDIIDASKPWSKKEDKILLKRFNELGGKWTKIAKELPGRSDLQVKIRYLNHIKNKKNRRKIESEESELSDYDFSSGDEKVDLTDKNDSFDKDDEIEENENENNNNNNNSIAESIHAETNLNDGFNNFNLNLDLPSSTLISEFFQFDENNFLCQSFGNDFLNWSFE